LCSYAARKVERHAVKSQQALTPFKGTEYDVKVTRLAAPCILFLCLLNEKRRYRFVSFLVFFG
jgi:hypothetical protein